MAELRNRNELEAAFANRLKRLSAKHQRRLVRAAGNPPRLASVPESFWLQVEREYREEITATILLLFFAAFTEHAPDSSQVLARLRASQYATRRGRAVASQVTQTRRATATSKISAIEVPETVPPRPIPRISQAQLNRQLSDIFSLAHAENIAVTETTEAAVGGGESGVRETVGLSEEDTWFTRNDIRVCPICEPLHDTKRSVWSQRVPGGPPAHPRCRCWIHYANEKRGRRVLGEGDVRRIVRDELLEHGQHDQSTHGRKGKGVTRLSAEEVAKQQRAKRAKKTHKRSTKSKQRHGEKVERELLPMTGGKTFIGNNPVDIETTIGGQLHGIEVKTLLDNGNDKVTVHPPSRRRKQAWAQERGGQLHLIAVDERDVFEGGRFADQFSGHKIYYRREVGAYRLSSMVKVRGRKHLRDLISGKVTEGMTVGAFIDDEFIGDVATNRGWFEFSEAHREDPFLIDLLDDGQTEDIPRVLEGLKQLDGDEIAQGLIALLEGKSGFLEISDGGE